MVMPWIWFPSCHPPSERWGAWTSENWQVHVASVLPPGLYNPESVKLMPHARHLVVARPCFPLSTPACWVRC